MLILAYFLLGVGIVGFFITFPLWYSEAISDRQMLGLTLVLSWAALWYAAALFIYEVTKERKRED